MPLLRVDGRLIYRDGTFGRGAHTPVAPVREAARFMDPPFRHVAPAAPAVAPRRRRGLAKYWWGRAVSLLPDKAGELIQAEEVRLPARVKLCRNRHESESVGVAYLFRYQGQVLALVEPDAAHPLTDDAWGASIGGQAQGKRRQRGYTEIVGLDPTDLVLTSSPIGGDECAVMNMRAPGFGRFAAGVLGFTKKERRP